MRGVGSWAVALRTPEGGITVEQEPLTSVLDRHRALRLPFVRGVVALVESLRIGVEALNRSAAVQLPEDERESLSGAAWVGTVTFALAMGVCLFFLLPATIASFVGQDVRSGLVFVLIEKAFRVSIFLLYLGLISRLGHLERVFQYHGAEHKAISCHEAGLPLTPENAQGFSRLHPRCGTSFLLIVMIVGIFVYAPLGKLDLPELLLSRVIGIPLVAGLAFEVLRAFGRHRGQLWARTLMWPGMQLQRLTTREPDLEQLEVAIVALEAVLEKEDGDVAPEDLIGLEVVA
jgi:uncharacterized protein YqhQ